MTIQPLLGYISKYITLTTEEQSILSSKIHIRKYLKGQFVVQQGDICQYESFVLSGCLKTFYMDPQGEEHVVRFSIENWWTADLSSFITQTPAHFNIQCLEHSELATLTFNDLEQLYLDVPKIERFFRIIIQKSLVATEKRIVENFTLSAKDRYLNFRTQYPQIEQRVPQYLIASYLGITKEFLSKIRSQLMNE